MRKKLYILMLLVAVCCYTQAQTDEHCEGWFEGLPNHYCICHATSQEFHFPLEMEINDTLWFVTTINDLKQGLSAYWFADCTVTFEIYAFCSSEIPTIKMTVGSNQMREMDIAEINRRLEEMGNMSGVLDVLRPRAKVYPNGGTGHVYCYPYDQGPASTCDDLLPFIPRMTYVCDKPSEVYELKPEKIPSSGQGFIRWKQQKNLEGTIRLTEGACDGPEIARATLTDSTRVMLMDPIKMKALKQAGTSVFVHVDHPADYVGRIFFHNRIIWSEQRIDTTLCQGKQLQLADTTLRETTVYPNDTLWTRGDTLSLTTYHLTIEPPELQYDTLLLKAGQLPMTYRNQYIAKDAWGNHDFTIREPNKCDERVLVNVIHDVVRKETEVFDTLCQGKTITYSGVEYAVDTVIRDSAWADADTWVVSDISIHFTEPELEYDTVQVPPSKMTVTGYWYSTLGVALFGYGDTLIVKTRKNQCTRKVQVTVVVADEPPITSVESIPYNNAGARKYVRDGIIYIRREGRDYDLTGRPIDGK